MSSQGQAVHYVAGGTVQAGEGVYVERTTDAELLLLCRKGAFAYVLTSRQMGKSSLMIRTAEKLLSEGIKPVIVDLTELGASATPEQWYRGFLEKVSDQLDLQGVVGTWWENRRNISAAQRFNLFMTDVVVGRVMDRVVIFVDEIDTTLRLDFTDDFFASIRYLYNARATNQALARLSFVLLGVASPGDLMKDPERTPFNIGERVDLGDFTEADALRDLNADPELVHSVFRYTQGHPYLSLRVFQSISQRPLTGDIESRIRALFFESQADKDSNLQFVRDMLTKRAPHRETVLLKYRDIWRGRKVPDEEADPIAVWLRLSGIVRVHNRLLVVRNPIYQRVFDDLWIRKNRTFNWLRASAYAGGAALGLLVLVAAILAPFAVKQKDEAVKQKIAATSLRLLAQAQQTQNTQPDLALLLELEAFRSADSLEARNSLLQGFQLSAARVFMFDHGSAVNRVVFSSDDRFVATAGADNAVRLWDSESHQPVGKPLAAQVLGDGVKGVAFSPNGKLLASVTNHAVALWSVTRIGAPTKLAELGSQTGPVLNLRFSPNSKLLALACEDKMLRLWDLSSGRLSRGPMKGHTDYLTDVEFSPDGSLMASASADNTVRLWDVEKGTPFGQVLQGHTSAVNGVAFSPTGKSLASASADGTLRIWNDLKTGSVDSSIVLHGHTSAVNSVAFSPNGNLLASASSDKTVRLWDPVTGESLAAPAQGHTDAVVSVAFSRNGKLLASGSADKTARLWDVGRLQSVGDLLQGHTDSVESLAFSPDSKMLASAGRDGTVRLWHLAEGKPYGQVMQGHVADVFGLAFSRDGKLLASGGGDGTVRLWGVEEQREIGKPLEGHATSVMGIQFDSGGKLLESVSADNSLKIWDVVTRQPLEQQQPQPLEPVDSVAFSLDGKLLAFASKDGILQIWNIALRHTLGPPLPGHARRVRGLAFSPDNKLLVSASEDSTFKLWDIATGQPSGPAFDGHKDSVLSAAFSPDGRLMASASGDKTVRLWDIATRQPFGQELQGHRDTVNFVLFSPDGTLLASASGDKTVRLWHLDPHFWTARICAIVNRNLSIYEWRQYVGRDTPYQKTCPSLPGG